MPQKAGIVEVEVRANLNRFRQSMHAGEVEARRFNSTAERGFGRTANSIGLMTTATRGATAALAKLRGTFGLVTGGIAAFAFYLGARQFAEFESTMNNVRAVSGAVGSEFALLNQKAQELGSTTKFTASDVSEAMSFMAMAGLQVGQIYTGVTATLNLAAAGNLDLGTSADIVTNIMTSMGLTASELGRAVDVLTDTFTSSNTNLVQLGQAFKFAAPLASTAGFKFEEVAAALGLMGNAGIQATLAGTSMRGIIQRLLAPSKEAEKVMRRLGLQIIDSSGNMKSFTEIVRQLEPILDRGASGISDLVTIFGARPTQGLVAVVKQGADELERFTAQLERSGGRAEEIARVQMEGLKGAFIEMKSAAEGLAIAIGESGLGKALEYMADSTTRALRHVTDLVRGLQELQEQSLRTLQTGLAEANSELQKLDESIAKFERLRDIGGIGPFGDKVRAEAALKNLQDQRKELVGNIDQMEEFIRLQRQLQETVVPKTGTAVEQVDLEAEPLPTTTVDAETQVAKRRAALNALQQLESSYLQITQQNRRLIETEYQNDLDKFKELLDQKLISEGEYIQARAELAEIFRLKLERIQNKELQVFQEIGQTISSSLEGAFREFIETGKVDFDQLTRSILADIATIILRLYVLKPLMESIFGGGAGGGLGGLVASIFHGGGVVGSGGPTRNVPPALFLGAPRLHNGGRILGPNEVPAILERGETVRRRGDNGSNVNIQIVNNTPAEVRQEEGRDANGDMVRRFVIEETNRAIVQGRMDGSLRSRFSSRVRGVRR